MCLFWFPIRLLLHWLWPKVRSTSNNMGDWKGAPDCWEASALRVLSSCSEPRDPEGYHGEAGNRWAFCRATLSWRDERRSEAKRATAVVHFHGHPTVSRPVRADNASWQRQSAIGLSGDRLQEELQPEAKPAKAREISSINATKRDCWSETSTSCHRRRKA